ncbi:MAG: SDR family oxidoreductase [Bacteroidota bacterium]
MQQKSIFITGAARGIGKATAHYFAQKGWYLGLLDMNEEELKALQKELGEGNSSIYLVDIREIDQIQKAITAFGERRGGKMDVLFNNAGILYSGGFEKVPLEKHKAIIDVNITGQINVTHIALPLLKSTPKSVVINMCSASSMFGNPELTAYAASKSALKSLTEGWYLLFKKHGIHVADILPAYVKTPMVTDEQAAMALPDRDVKLSADQIAKAVWKAAHSKKMHHYVGTDARLLKVVKWLLPQSWLLAILKKGFYEDALRKN